MILTVTCDPLRRFQPLFINLNGIRYQVHIGKSRSWHGRERRDRDSDRNARGRRGIMIQVLLVNLRPPTAFGSESLPCQSASEPDSEWR